MNDQYLQMDSIYYVCIPSCTYLAGSGCFGAHHLLGISENMSIAIVRNIINANKSMLRKTLHSTKDVQLPNCFNIIAFMQPVIEILLK